MPETVLYAGLALRNRLVPAFFVHIGSRRMYDAAHRRLHLTYASWRRCDSLVDAQQLGQNLLCISVLSVWTALTTGLISSLRRLLPCTVGPSLCHPGHPITTKSIMTHAIVTSHRAPRRQIDLKIVPQIGLLELASVPAPIVNGWNYVTSTSRFEKRFISARHVAWASRLTQVKHLVVVMAMNKLGVRCFVAGRLTVCSRELKGRHR
jgi:hypothetical protein